MRDNLRNLQVVHLGNLVMSGTDVLKSKFVDLRGFDSCTIKVVNNVVADAGTASGFTSKLVHSVDAADANATDCVAADTPDGTITITTTSNSDDQIISGGMGYIGSKRFVGVTATGTTLSDADISIIAILSRASRQPTSFVGTAVART